MINIKPSAIIYIACPPSEATGGPLALHQLAFKLKSLGLNTAMYYFEETTDDPVHENYKEYNIPYVFNVDDTKENVLIVPELKSQLIYSVKNMRCAIWWLSIDNYYGRPIIHDLFKIFGYSKPNINFTHWFSRFKLSLFKKKKFKFNNVDNFYHLTQSEYAYRYISNKTIARKDNVAMLSDYLMPIFFQKEESISKKENIVLYNPVKGEVFTKKLLKLGENIKWIPIKNMTPLEVKNLLNRAKVYIDFGEHPGRDRFPREAAISGCCIITGKRGAANFHEDVPINNEFKIEETNENIPIIVDKIKYILENYETENQKFEPYREFIKKNEIVFEEEINEIFKKTGAKV